MSKKILQDSVKLSFERIEDVLNTDYFLYVGIDGDSLRHYSGEINLYKDKGNITDDKIVYGIALDVDDPFTEETEDELSVRTLAEWIIQRELASNYDRVNYTVNSEIGTVIQPFRDYYIRMPIVDFKEEVNKEFVELGFKDLPYDKELITSAKEENEADRVRYERYLEIAQYLVNDIEELEGLQQELNYIGGILGEQTLKRDEEAGTVIKEYVIHGDYIYNRHYSKVSVIFEESISKENIVYPKEHLEFLAQKVRRIERFRRDNPEKPIDYILANY